MVLLLGESLMLRLVSCCSFRMAVVAGFQCWCAYSRSTCKQNEATTGVLCTCAGRNCRWVP